MRRRLRLVTGYVLAAIGIAVAAGQSIAQRYEYVVTFDRVAVQGIEGYVETPAVAHRDPPKEAEAVTSSEDRRERSDERRLEVQPLLSPGTRRQLSPQAEQPYGVLRPGPSAER